MASRQRVEDMDANHHPIDEVAIIVALVSYGLGKAGLLPQNYLSWQRWLAVIFISVFALLLVKLIFDLLVAAIQQ